MISYIDTDKVENIANELSKAATDIENEFTTLYKRFSNVPTVTKEWVGNQANLYFSRIAGDKQQYLNLADSIRNLSKELRTEAASTKSNVKSTNTKD